MSKIPHYGSYSNKKRRYEESTAYEPTAGHTEGHITSLQGATTLHPRNWQTAAPLGGIDNYISSIQISGERIDGYNPSSLTFCSSEPPFQLLAPAVARNSQVCSGQSSSFPYGQPYILPNTSIGISGPQALGVEDNSQGHNTLLSGQQQAAWEFTVCQQTLTHNEFRIQEDPACQPGRSDFLVSASSQAHHDRLSRLAPLFNPDVYLVLADEPEDLILFLVNTRATIPVRENYKSIATL